MLWVKAFHIIFMVTWFAGLFYLPRLFVYHADTKDPISLDRFKIMERRLFVIMTIGALGTVVFGLWLLIGYLPGFAQAAWFQWKFLLVLGLVAYHAYLWVHVHRFSEQRDASSVKFYRLINELPAFFLIAIVILVTVKPI